MLRLGLQGACRWGGAGAISAHDVSRHPRAQGAPCGLHCQQRRLSPAAHLYSCCTASPRHAFALPGRGCRQSQMRIVLLAMRLHYATSYRDAHNTFTAQKNDNGADGEENSKVACFSAAGAPQTFRCSSNNSKVLVISAYTSYSNLAYELHVNSQTVWCRVSPPGRHLPYRA